MRITLKRFIVFGVYTLGFFLILFHITRHLSFQRSSIVILPNYISTIFPNNKSEIFHSQICNLLGGNFSKSVEGNSFNCSPSAFIHYYLSSGIESVLKLYVTGCLEHKYQQLTFQKLLIDDSSRSTIFSAYCDHRLKYSVRIISLVNTFKFNSLNCILYYGTVIKSSDNDVIVQIDQYLSASANFVQLPEWKNRQYVYLNLNLKNLLSNLTKYILP